MAVLMTSGGVIPSKVNFVNYLRSTGSQYFNLGFNPNQNTRVVMKVKFQSSAASWLFGVRNSSGGESFGFMCPGSGQYRSDYGSEKTVFTGNYSEAFTIDKNRNVTTINGSSVATHTETTFQSSLPMFLLDANTGGSASKSGANTDLYYCKVYDNDTLILDLWPCYDKEGVACLYDKVSSSYYYNAGTGELTAG